ncbi:Arc family DNA-binding protein [Mesorhizobium sp. C420B]|uniref:Arc family DNA-binding protein n=1 Tax=unclassified Mesorhizobium TaxID=325217 RepID=UPI0009FC751B|nr:Arc family DNA-binding protein [Mesorhizobium sp. LSHC420B00]
MFPSSDAPKLTIRVPKDVKNWLEKQAERNASSHASEIVRAVRERMERAAKQDVA